jgi:hypothetical protein
MNLARVYLVNRHLQKTTRRELAGLRNLLDPLPRGYGEFVTTFGSGDLCDVLRIWTPEEIRRRVPEYRKYVEQTLELLKGVPRADFLNAVPIAMSIDGDEIVVCPDHPRSLFLLPRQDMWVHRLPRGLERPLLWERVTDKSRRYSPHEQDFYYFQSDVRRASVSLFTAGHFRRNEIAALVEEMWSKSEIRRIEEEGATFLFPRAINGRVQLTGGLEDADGRVGICISFDSTALTKVDLAIRRLEAMGFYETSRTQCKTKA